MSKGRLLWTYLAVVAVGNMLIHSSVNICFALVPVFISEFSINVEVIGLIVMTPLIVRALAGLPSGMISDRFDGRRLFVLSLLLVAVGGLIVSRSQTILMLVVGFSIISLGQVIFHPAAYTIITRLFEARRRNLALGLNGAGGTLGVAVGPISVGLIMYFLGQSSWRTGYLLWVVPAIACSSLAFLLKLGGTKLSEYSRAFPGPIEDRDPFRSIFTRTYIVFLVMVGIRSFGIQSISTYMTTYLKESHGMSLGFASVLFGTMSLMGIFAAPMVGLLADRRGEKNVLSLAYLGEAVMLVGVALSPNLYFLIPLIILYGFMENAALAPSSALVAKLSPANRRGAAYALYSLASNLAGALAPLVSALVVYQLGVWYIFPVATVMFFLAFAILRVILGQRVT